MHQHDWAARLRHHLQRAIVPQKRGDIVDDRRPCRQRRLHHASLARIDRNERSAAREAFDHRHDTRDLIAFPHRRGPGPGRFAADVDQRGTGLRHRHTRTGGGGRIVMHRTAVRKTVGRHVEDARDQRLVKAQRPLAQHQRRARRGDRGVERGSALVAQQRAKLGHGHGAPPPVLDHFISGEP